MVSFTDVNDYTKEIARNTSFVYPRGDGFHILLQNLDEQFVQVRTKGPGLRLSGRFMKEMDNLSIWKALLDTLSFDGIDFEHFYGIIGQENEDGAYSFAEIMILSHTILICPVRVKFAPFKPRMDKTDGIAEIQGAGEPMLVIGVVGDCVKGTNYDKIAKAASEGDSEAKAKVEILHDVGRLQQKLSTMAEALLKCCPASIKLHFQLTLVGSGAFGGKIADMGEKFIQSLNSVELRKGDMCDFFAFGPGMKELSEKWNDGDIKITQPSKKRYNPPQGPGDFSNLEANMMRVLVAGIDPVSNFPHGNRYRAVSLEGQLSAATDILERLGFCSERAFNWIKAVKEDNSIYETLRFIPKAINAATSLLRPVTTVASNGDSVEGWVIEEIQNMDF